MKQLDFKFGILPEIDAFIPERAETMLSVAAITAGSAVIGDFLTVSNTGATLAGVGISLLTAWFIDRHQTRAQRGGYLGDQPTCMITTTPAANTNSSGANWELTEFFRKELGIDTIVTETRSNQYRILKINSFNPAKVERHLDTIASKLGRNPDEILFYPVFAAGVCAVMEILPDNQWQTVTYKPEHLVAGELVSYVGDAIDGNAITFNRRQGSHLLISGMTDSGKTEVMCNDIESMRRSGTPVEIYICDPKDTAQLQRQNATWYSTDVEASIQKMEYLLTTVGNERRARYAKAGCDNFFEYRDTVNAAEPAIFYYIDELAEFLEKDLGEVLEKGEIPRHRRAMHVFTRFIQKQRSVGIFLICGLQHPEADTLPTKAMMNFAVSVTLSVKNETAARVAGAPGASKLPLKGGLIFQYQKRVVIGRAAYLKAI